MYKMYGLLDALKIKKFFLVFCFILYLGCVPHLHCFHSLMVFRCSFWWNLFYACVPNWAQKTVCCGFRMLFVSIFLVVAIEGISSFVMIIIIIILYVIAIMAVLLILRYHRLNNHHHSFLHWIINFLFDRWKILIHRSIAFVCQWLK